jgi:hypothetical protein
VQDGQREVRHRRARAKRQNGAARKQFDNHFGNPPVGCSVEESDANRTTSQKAVALSQRQVA